VWHTVNNGMEDLEHLEALAIGVLQDGQLEQRDAVRPHITAHPVWLARCLGVEPLGRQVPPTAHLALDERLPGVRA
jgi:hypothetical protein